MAHTRISVSRDHISQMLWTAFFEGDFVEGQPILPHQYPGGKIRIAFQLASNRDDGYLDRVQALYDEQVALVYVPDDLYHHLLDQIEKH